MKKSANHQKTGRFYETVTQEARKHAVRLLSLTDDENQATLGLIVYDDSLGRPRAAHLLRKTALTLAGSHQTAAVEADPQPESCHVTVEERAQLFTLFGAGTK